MASNSHRRSGSSGRSRERRTVHIGGTSGAEGGAKPPRARVRTPDPPVTPAKRESPAARAKRLERERRATRRRAAWRLRAAVAATMLVAAGWGAAALYRSDLFSVERVEVAGNVRMSAEEVRAIAAVPAGATLLRFPGGEVAARLEADPRVASAEVSRRFPDGMVLRLTERVPAALVDDGKRTFWLVDADGFVMGRRSTEETAALPVIRDIERLEVAAGERTGTEALLNALMVLAGLSPDLRSQVRTVSAPTVEKTAVYTVDDVEIFFGSAEDIEKKDAIARRILAEQAGKVVYINVRTVDRPTYRSLDDVR